MQNHSSSQRRALRYALFGLLLFLWIILALVRQALFADPEQRSSVLLMLAVQSVLGAGYLGALWWQSRLTTGHRFGWVPVLLAILISATSLLSLYVWIWWQA